LLDAWRGPYRVDRRGDDAPVLYTTDGVDFGRLREGIVTVVGFLDHGWVRVHVDGVLELDGIMRLGDLSYVVPRDVRLATSPPTFVPKGAGLHIDGLDASSLRVTYVVEFGAGLGPIVMGDIQRVPISTVLSRETLMANADPVMSAEPRLLSAAHDVALRDAPSGEIVFTIPAARGPFHGNPRIRPSNLTYDVVRTATAAGWSQIRIGFGPFIEGWIDAGLQSGGVWTPLCSGFGSGPGLMMEFSAYSEFPKRCIEDRATLYVGGNSVGHVHGQALASVLEPDLGGGRALIVAYFGGPLVRVEVEADRLRLLEGSRCQPTD
jgi:hypothetical protein